MNNENNEMNNLEGQTNSTVTPETSNVTVEPTTVDAPVDVVPPVTPEVNVEVTPETPNVTVEPTTVQPTVDVVPPVTPEVNAEVTPETPNVTVEPTTAQPTVDAVPPVTPEVNVTPSVVEQPAAVEPVSQVTPEVTTPVIPDVPSLNPQPNMTDPTIVPDGNQASQTPEEPKKKSNTTLIIIIAVVVLIGLAAGLYFILSGKDNEKENNNDNKSSENNNQSNNKNDDDNTVSDNAAKQFLDLANVYVSAVDKLWKEDKMLCQDGKDQKKKMKPSELSDKDAYDGPAYYYVFIDTKNNSEMKLDVENDTDVAGWVRIGKQDNSYYVALSDGTTYIVDRGTDNGIKSTDLTVKDVVTNGNGSNYQYMNGEIFGSNTEGKGWGIGDYKLLTDGDDDNNGIYMSNGKKDAGWTPFCSNLEE